MHEHTSGTRPAPLTIRATAEGQTSEGAVLTSSKGTEMNVKFRAEALWKQNKLRDCVPWEMSWMDARAAIFSGGTLSSEPTTYIVYTFELYCACDLPHYYYCTRLLLLLLCPLLRFFRLCFCAFFHHYNFTYAAARCCRSFVSRFIPVGMMRTQFIAAHANSRPKLFSPLVLLVMRWLYLLKFTSRP